MDKIQFSFTRNFSILRAKASKPAIYGVLIAVIAIIIATLLGSYILTGQISLGGIIQIQKTNVALWFLDLSPFLFAIWGQYVSSMLAFEAGAMVEEQTNELIQETNALEKRVSHQLMHDALTDLPNQILFLDRLNQALQRLREEKTDLYVLVILVNEIKDINSSLGHYNSDRILKQIASRLRGVIHEPNTLARLNNDEFGIILLKVNNLDQVTKTIEHIRKALSLPFGLDELQLNLQFSIGVAKSFDQGSDGDTILQRAEVAMQEAFKEKIDCAIYDSKMDKKHQRVLIITNDLRHAMEEGDLVLYYQPKVNIKTGHVTSEALIRWNHPELGLVAPENFIPMAERTGLIRNISDWVLNQALQQCSKWQQEGFMEREISINLSALDLMDVELPDKLTGLLASYEIQPWQITIEVTESSVMIDQDRALAVMTRIAELGCKVSIDDFGTGYSSLAYLSKLPVDKLKIDRSFVTRMDKDGRDNMIVHSIIDLAHNLGLKVVAEGVENQSIMQQLHAYGCDVVQGFYISYPVPAPAFREWVEGFVWQAKKIEWFGSK